MKAAFWILTLTFGIAGTALALPGAIRNTNIVLPHASDVLDVVSYDATLDACHGRLKAEAPADVRRMTELFPWMAWGMAQKRLDNALASGKSKTELYLICKLAPIDTVQTKFR